MIALVKGLWQRMAFLEEWVKGLENQCRKNSRNSSKPLPSDEFKPRTKSLRSKSERYSDGQTGHPGSTLLSSLPVERVELHRVAAYEVCRALLVDTALEAWDARQVQDLASIQLAVTVPQAEVKCCPH